ncbi:iron-sulfur cluster assembly accessory protein [Balneolaceae bacterium ANBcel3]|nr:iron-sulfur cluster assembly accessory protein [Balneolaceae bacterium ANBcel3]
MAIQISESARNRILEIREQSETGQPETLRIGVTGGGCSGLTYKIDFEEQSESGKKDDQYFDVDGIQVVIDMRSFLYLAGTMLEYSSGLQGKGFHFINPNAVRTCSCGESFSV